MSILMWPNGKADNYDPLATAYGISLLTWSVVRKSSEFSILIIVDQVSQNYEDSLIFEETEDSESEEELETEELITEDNKVQI